MHAAAVTGHLCSPPKASQAVLKVLGVAMEPTARSATWVLRLGRSRSGFRGGCLAGLRALRPSQLREGEVSSRGIRVLITEDLLPAGECPAEEFFGLLAAALLRDHFGQLETCAQCVRVVFAEHPPPVAEHSGKHGLGFLVPALTPDNPSEAAPGNEGVRMVITHDLKPRGERFLVDQLSLGVPALRAQRAA